MTALVRLLALLGLTVSLTGASPAAAAAGVPSVSDPRYFAGANVPWFNWACDFGCSAKSGVSSPAVKSSVADGFARLKAANMHAVRWWMFEGDPWQINHDASGAPVSLNPAVYDDLDAALALADQYDLAYDLVLFTGPTSLPRAWITDAGQRQKLANALAPMFERYKDNPHILSWELFNEPEWDTWNQKIPLAPTQATVQLLASTIHARTHTAVTVGSANLDGISQWVGLGLDYYSPHWYDPMSSGTACARCTDAPTAASLNHIEGAPIVLGEFYAGPDTDTLQRFKDFRAKGYAGAWAWSLFSDHTSDKMKIDLGAVTTFTAAGPGPAPAPQSPGSPPAAAPTASSDIHLLANWVTPTYAAPGDQITLHQDLQTGHDASVQVEFDVLNEQGQKVSQATVENQALSASGITPVETSLSLPAGLPEGTYTVNIGVFAPGGATRFDASDAAATFVVSAPPIAPIPAADQPAPDSDASQGS